MTLVRFFEDPTTLDEAGGKAVNLSRLTRAGFPVPLGFTVTTEAFRVALHERGLRDRVDIALANADLDDPGSVEEASRRIRAAFADTPATTVLTEPVARAVLDAYRKLGGGPVAVRSSATAEDLPDLSFAGQQDTLAGRLGRSGTASTRWSPAGRACGPRERSPTGAAPISPTTRPPSPSRCSAWSRPTRRASCSRRTRSPGTGARWPSTRRSGSARRWSPASSNPTTTSPTPARDVSSSGRSAPRPS
jgi:hypothetical protein